MSQLLLTGLYFLTVKYSNKFVLILRPPAAEGLFQLKLLKTPNTLHCLILKSNVESLLKISTQAETLQPREQISKNVV